MEELVEPDIDVDVCPACGGRFLDKGELNTLAIGLAGDIELRSLVWTDVIHTTEDTIQADTFPVRSCPLCSNQMKKVGLVPFVDVVFDFCEQCECFFLDAGETETMNRLLREESPGGFGDEYRGWRQEHLVRGNKLNGVELVPGLASTTGVPATHIQIVVYFKKPLGIGLHIYAEKWTAKLAKTFGLFGKQDIVVGDDEFDSTFIVQGDEPNEVQRLLSSELRQAMVQFVSRKPKIFKIPGSLDVLDFCVCFTEGPYSGGVKLDWETGPGAIVDGPIIDELVDLATSIEEGL